MPILARHNLLWRLTFFYLVSLFVYNVFYVATTLLSAEVHTSWESAHNGLKCFFWKFGDFFLYVFFWVHVSL